jgi:hypothetical protein
MPRSKERAMFCKRRRNRLERFVKTRRYFYAGRRKAENRAYVFAGEAPRDRAG